jgi:hypothetical protein
MERTISPKVPGESAARADPPHILLMLLDDLPVETEAATLASLNLPGLDVRVMHRKNTPFAGMELYLPTAAMLFVAAGFFNGFLQKAGEDGYDALKIAAKALWRKMQGLSLVLVGTPGKVPANRRFSLAYSIAGEIVPGISFKFMLQSDIDPQDAEKRIVAFLDLIAAVHNDRLENPDMEALLTYRPVGGIVVVTYDAEQCKIVPVNAFSE